MVEISEGKISIKMLLNNYFTALMKIGNVGYLKAYYLKKLFIKLLE